MNKKKTYDTSSYAMPSNNTAPSYNYPPPSQLNPSDIEESESEIKQYRAYSDICNVPGLTEAEKELLRSAGPDYIDELKRLAELRDGGTITEEEFQKEKKEILYRANLVEMITCTYCGSTCEAYLARCPSCGAPLKADKSE